MLYIWWHLHLSWLINTSPLNSCKIRWWGRINATTFARVNPTRKEYYNIKFNCCVSNLESRWNQIFQVRVSNRVIHQIHCIDFLSQGFSATLSGWKHFSRFVVGNIVETSQKSSRLSEVLKLFIRTKYSSSVSRGSWIVTKSTRCTRADSTPFYKWWMTYNMDKPILIGKQYSHWACNFFPSGRIRTFRLAVPF